MASELREQLAHAFESVEEMERLDASSRALRHAVLDAEDDCGAAKALYDTTGDNADHAAMPAAAPEHQGGVAVRNRGFEAAIEDLFDDGAFRGLAVLIESEEFARNFGRL